MPRPAPSPTSSRSSCSRTRWKFPGRRPTRSAPPRATPTPTVVMGVCEKLPNTTGTMFNTQIYFGPDGRIIRKHQKIMPTVGERLVHMGGYGDTFGAFDTEYRPDVGADLRRELQSAGGVRADRRRHPHPCHELAQPFPDQRRSAAQSRRDRLAGVRADEQGVRDLGLRHRRRAHDRDAEGRARRARSSCAIRTAAAAR